MAYGKTNATTSSGSGSGGDIITAINYTGDTTQVDQKVWINKNCIKSNTFTSKISNSAYPFIFVDDFIYFDGNNLYSIKQNKNIQTLNTTITSGNYQFIDKNKNFLVFRSSTNNFYCFIYSKKDKKIYTINEDNLHNTGGCWGPLDFIIPNSDSWVQFGYSPSTKIIRKLKDDFTLEETEYSVDYVYNYRTYFFFINNTLFGIESDKIYYYYLDEENKQYIKSNLVYTIKNSQIYNGLDTINTYKNLIIINTYTVNYLVLRFDSENNKLTEATDIEDAMSNIYSDLSLIKIRYDPSNNLFYFMYYNKDSPTVQEANTDFNKYIQIFQLTDSGVKKINIILDLSDINETYLNVNNTVTISPNKNYILLASNKISSTANISLKYLYTIKSINYFYFFNYTNGYINSNSFIGYSNGMIVNNSEGSIRTILNNKTNLTLTVNDVTSTRRCTME